MAEREGGGQQHRNRDEQVDEVEDAPQVDLAERKASLDEDIDDLLADIDGVLETNAEEFVRGFVQKGGQ